MNVIQGCTCCGTCEICRDSFTRADDTDISANIVTPDTASGWTESSGTWDITSNQLVSTAPGIVICDDPHPDGDITMSVEVDFKHDTSGRTCDVLVGYVDANNYFYARYLVAGASGSVALRTVVAGVDSQVAISATVTININTTYAARVCVTDGGTISASLAGTQRVFSAPQSMTGVSCGLGASGAGTATFDNFVFTKGYKATTAEACPRCINCQACTGVAAEQYQIVVAGTQSGALDGTYIVSPHEVCLWRTTFASKCGAYTEIYYQNTGTSDLVYFGAGNCTFRVTGLSNPHDCLTERTLTPLLATCPCTSPNPVTLTGATAVVTPL